MSSWYWKIIGIMILLPASAFCQQSLDCIAQKNLERLSKIELSENDSKNRIITFIVLNESENNIEIARKYLDRNNSKLHLLSLYPLYLIARIGKTDLADDNIMKYLLKYKELESDNSLPYYLLSYYYAKNKKYELSLRYITEGNAKQKVERHSREKADIIVKYLLSQKENELTAYYSQLKLYALDSFQVYRKLSLKLLKSDIKYTAANEIYKMGLKLCNNSYSILDKLISNAIQNDALISEIYDPNKKKLYDQLMENKQNIIELSAQIEKIVKDDELITFLKEMKNVGELAAIKRAVAKVN